MALFRFGKEQRDGGVHRTSSEQQGCATILRSVKITVTVSPGPTHRETQSLGSSQIQGKSHPLANQKLPLLEETQEGEERLNSLQVRIKILLKQK